MTLEDYRNAIFKANEDRDLATYRQLGEAHPEFFHRSDTGYHLIFMDARFGRGEFVKAAIELGIDVNAPRSVVVNMPEGVVSSATNGGDVELVAWLLDRGAKLNFEFDGILSCRPLQDAVQNGDLEMVQLLVDRGAAVTTFAHENTPLSLAIAWKYDEIAEFLRSKGFKETWEVTGGTPESAEPDEPPGQ